MICWFIIQFSKSTNLETISNAAFDISKAFDELWHSALSNNLSFHVLPLPLCLWISSDAYLLLSMVFHFILNKSMPCLSRFHTRHYDICWIILLSSICHYSFHPHHVYYYFWHSLARFLINFWPAITKSSEIQCFKYLGIFSDNHNHIIVSSNFEKITTTLTLSKSVINTTSNVLGSLNLLPSQLQEIGISLSTS